MVKSNADPRGKLNRLYRGWCMYDWANSAYNLVITSTIFPIYYMAVTSDKDDSTPDIVSFFGFEAINSSMLNYALAFAYLMIAFISPILSSIADYRGTKKRFMKIFTYIGALACCGLFFFDAAHIELALILAIVAAIGYSGGIVFNNAYLPEIAPESYHDRLSAKGYAFGYVGSVILQLICFSIIIYLPEESTFGVRLSFLLVGLWWIGFSQIPFRILPAGTPNGVGLKRNILSNGFHELKTVYEQLKHHQLLKIYLNAFFFYSMGVQTVMLAAAEFAVREIKKEVNGVWVNLDIGELITIIVIIQLVAIAGAMLMASLSKWIGNIKVLMLTVLLWIGICAAAYYTHTATQFYFLAALVGLVMGGIQAMSRSTFSKLMPKTKDTASFFSFYNVAEKVALALGLFTFGLIEHLTGNMRNSIFALAGFFVLGFFLLLATEWMRKKEGMDIHLSTNTLQKTESTGS
ncbi:MAG TPA: MFS transporter [Saprospiraceae bacterium]